MARKLIVEIVGDATSYEKSLVVATRSTRKFGREMEHSVRGIASGTNAMHSFGRSLAFASGGFIAFEGVSRFLTESVNAAREAGVAQRALAAQMKAAGESFKGNREQVERVATSYERFGFQNDKVVEGLTVLERGTGKLSSSMKLLQLTADIARAKNIDFTASAQVVAKVFGGQETALRRAVPGLEKNAHGWDLIREAQRKMAGQAAANTTVSERFAATLHDTEEIIGTALLPILNKYLGSLSRWLQRMNESGRLQRDVQATAKALGAAFSFVTRVVKTLTGAFRALSSAVGGTKHAIELLVAVIAAWKLSGFILGLQGATAATTAFGGAAEGAAAGGLLSMRLALIGKFGIAAAAGLAGFELSRLIRKIPGWDGAFRSFGGTLYDVAHKLGLVHTASAQAVPTRPPGLRGPAGKPGGDLLPPGLEGPLGDPTTVTKIKRSAEQLNAWFDAMIGRKESRVQDIASLQGQIKAWETIRALLIKRLAITKDITRRYKLEGDIADVNRAIRDVQKQRAQNAKDAAQQRKEAAQRAAQAAKEAEQRRKAAAAAAKQARDARLQTKLDWAEFALERAQDTKGLKDDIAALKVIIALIKQQIRQTGLTVDLARQLYQSRKQLRDALHPPGGHRGRRPDEIPVGGDFIPARGGSVGAIPPVSPPASTPSTGFQPAGSSYQIHNLNLFGVQDVPGMEQQLQKRAMARPQTRRGPI